MDAKQTRDQDFEVRMQRLRDRGAPARVPLQWFAILSMLQRWHSATGLMQTHLGHALDRQIHQVENHWHEMGSEIEGAKDQRRRILRTDFSLLAEALPQRAQPHVLGEVRQLHARVKLRQQLQTNLQQSFGHAGPLHSERLVQLSIRRMQGWSEPYLHRFLGHLDALVALEDAGRPTQVKSPSQPGTNKRAKSKRS